MIEELSNLFDIYQFKIICEFCRKYMGMIPINFFLAFYVSHVVTRWWAQWNVGLKVCTISYNIGKFAGNSLA